MESDCHTDVYEYFQIDCPRGCPRVFSNSLSHAGVQEYFLIDCHTQVSRSMIDTVDTVDTDDTVYTVYTVYTVFTVYTVYTFYTVQTALHCLNKSIPLRLL